MLLTGMPAVVPLACGRHASLGELPRRPDEAAALNHRDSSPFRAAASTVSWYQPTKTVPGEDFAEGVKFVGTVERDCSTSNDSTHLTKRNFHPVFRRTQTAKLLRTSLCSVLTLPLHHISFLMTAG
jgi:hypothetical protein